MSLSGYNFYVSGQITYLGFNAYAKTGAIELDWTVTNQVDIDYFSVERSEDSFTFLTLSYLAGGGTTDDTLSYVYGDSTVSALKKYYYRIRHATGNGGIGYSSLLEVFYDSSASGTSLIHDKNIHFSVSPNPMREKAMLSFENSGHELCTFTVSDVSGKQIRKISGIRGSAVEIVRERLSPGLYLYRIFRNGVPIVSGKILVE